MPNLLAFGDSVTKGIGDSEGGWVARLQREVESTDPGNDFSVYNLGVKGDTSRSVKERFEDEAERRKTSQETVLIFQVGINDSQFLLNEERNRVSIEEFRQNLEEIQRKARFLADEVFFLGLTPIVESKLDPLPWNGRKRYRFKDVREYEDELYDFCEHHDLNFIELFDRFMEKEYGSLLADGLHPNEKGHEIIKEAVKKELEKKQLLDAKNI